MGQHRRFRRDDKPSIPYGEANQAFESVIDSYISHRLELRYAPLGCSLPKDDSAKRKVNSFLLIEFCCDVERAIALAIGHDPVAQADLAFYFRQYLELLRAGEDKLPEQRRQTLAHRIGSVFVERHLSPNQYFRHIRKKVR